MNPQAWVFLAIAAWFGAEFGIARRGIRVVVQCCLVLVLLFYAYSFGRVMGGIMPTMQGNQLLKNLTQALEAIGPKTGEEQTLLQERVRVLNKGVLPTYQTFSYSREAVEKFLSAYGIKYDPDIPMPKD